ncbi:MAG TPA: PVC-type heme-binding CxxCH protein [Pirellulales bacterium]|nr:PVC-type heme-binding CxxCH protein [Pirellulales bacterium]
MLIAGGLVRADDSAPQPGPATGKHTRLLFYCGADGREQPVRTPADWQRRRSQILEGMRQAMGTLPDRTKLDIPTMEVIEEVKEPHFTRLTVKIAVDAEHSVPAYLYLPAQRPPGTRTAAVLALHQTEGIGKRSVDGQGQSDQRYGRELAERGYVVLAPDYPSFGDYPCDFSDPRFASGSLLGVFNHMRCIDLLVARDDVDAARIGVIGHSLGGHNSMFLAVFDERVKATVSNCGWDPFHDYKGGKIDPWAQARYIPRIRSAFGSDPDRVPFDFYEVVAAIAPRAFLSISPVHDDNFSVAGVQRAIPRAEEVYQLLGAGDRLAARYPDCQHSFPPDERTAAYAFLDGHLGHHSPDSPAGLAGELPRVAPHEPSDALQTFAVVPGFHIEQVAAEPLVRSPVAVAFDADGALFVVEMRDYSEQDRDFLGTVRRLEDTDGDGRFDRSTVFVDHLSWPTAIACAGGGIFIGAAPDILFCRDTDGDGRADMRKVVFTGFGRGNVQGLLNSFQWGLDSRIYGATSSSGGVVHPAGDNAAAAINLNGRDFSFDPVRLDLRAESGGAQHGMCFDDWGRRFVCSNSDHIQMVMFEDRYAARNPLFPAPPARRSIAADGGAAAVFRTSPVEAWRIVRTRMRIANSALGMVEGGGRAAGYFTGATGVTCYRGDAFPSEMRRQAFVGDVGSNLVHRKALSDDGIGLVARRIDEGREFVASSDIWFRPAQFANAPDGTLYIVDVYREVIEHPASLPPEIKQHLDLTSGRDRGRIYRVVPDGFVQPPLSHLTTASTAELVGSLEHRNGWYRDTAARLLFERRDLGAVPAVEHLAAMSALPEARMHALYVLAGLDRLSPRVVLTALDDAHPRVREHAVRLAERQSGDSTIAQKLFAMTGDDDPRVRYQLAFSLGDFTGRDRDAALARLARQDGSDPLVRTAIFSSLAHGAGNVLAALLEDTKTRNSPPLQEVLEPLAAQIGQRSDPAELSQLEQALASLSEGDGVVTAVAHGLAAGRARDAAGNVPEPVALGPRSAAAVERLLAAAERVALDESLATDDRVDAAKTLAFGSFTHEAKTLESLLDNRHPQEIQVAVLDTLGKFSDPAIAEVLIGAWPRFSPRLRGAAGNVLLSRPAWIAAVLDAAEAGRIALGDFDPTRLKVLETRISPEMRQRLTKLIAPLTSGPRQEIVSAYQPALSLSGQLARGRIHFQRICASCHRLEGVGNEVGPSLSAIKNRGAEAILLNLLDPNREVNPQYVNYVAVLTDGRVLSGMIAGESATSITLRRAENATDTIQRNDIEELHSTRQSLMPEGLEKQLDPQAVADLIAYLLAAP